MVEFVAAAMVAAATCAVPDRPPAVVRAAQPDFPAIAQQQGIFGTVQVAVTVAPDGSVTEVRIVRSPSAILNAAAVHAARVSTYQPQLRDCAPVTGDYLLTVRFAAPSSNISTRTLARGEMAAAVSTQATVFRYPDRVSVNALFISHGVSEAAAFTANEAAFAKIVRETEGIATARTIIAPRSIGTPGRFRTPPPAGSTPAPDVGVLRQMGLRVNRFVDVPRVVDVYETNDAEFIEAYWSLRDSSEAEREALALAIREARTEVDAFARSRGLHVVAVLRVEPERPRRPYYAESSPNFAASDRTRFPEGPPYVSVKRDVTVTYRLRH
jgi:TonB family protein